MPPRKPPEHWWQARSGALVALAIALGTGWLADARTEGSLAAGASSTSRELDLIQRRLDSLEARCK